MTRPFSMPFSPMALSLALVACEVEETLSDPYCFTTADCPPGSVCSAFEGICKPEPEDGLTGTFQCVVNGFADDAPGEALASDIMGSLNGERFVLSGAPGCNVLTAMDPEGRAQSELHAYVPLPHDFDTALQISFGALRPDGAAFGELEFESPSSGAFATPSARLVTMPSGEDWRERSRVHAVSNGGFGYLPDAVDSGSVFSGFVELQMMPTAPVFVDWWAECQVDSAATCGESVDAVCIPASAGGSVCSRRCGDEYPCDAGQSCQDGVCRLDCAEDADCPAPLVCGGSAGSGGCT